MTEAMGPMARDAELVRLRYERDLAYAALDRAMAERDRLQTELLQDEISFSSSSADWMLVRDLGLKEQITWLSWKLHEHRTSTSWRVTAPLRAIGRLRVAAPLRAIVRRWHV